MTLFKCTTWSLNVVYTEKWLQAYEATNTADCVFSSAKFPSFIKYSPFACIVILTDLGWLAGLKSFPAVENAAMSLGSTLRMAHYYLSESFNRNQECKYLTWVGLAEVTRCAALSFISAMSVSLSSLELSLEE